MSHPWLAQYPAEVPADIDVTPYPSLVQLIDDALTRHAARPLISSAGRGYSGIDLDVASRRFGAWLQSRGIGKGDRVALMMPNVMPFVAATLGTLRAGGVVVTVNPLYTPRELAHQLKDSGARVLVVFEAFASTAAAALADANVQDLVVVGTGREGGQPAPLPGQVSFQQTLQAGALAPFTAPAVGPDDLAFLQYTGGTTGISKGAMLKHRNVMANMMQIDAWLRPAMPAGDATGLNIVSFLPMYHIFALTVCLLHGLRSGMHNLLVANPRDLAGAVKELGGLPIHIFPAVNTMFGALVAQPKLMQAIDLTQLRLCLSGGTAVQQGVAQKWQAATGVAICEGYGLSETSPVASCNLATASAWTGTIGLPVSNTELSIRDDDGREVAVGESGEIWIRGPQVMAGYWQRPDETAKVMTTDGFFKSGDIGVMDARGFVKIVDRKKDMILVSGFNVFPNEIEDVLSTLPGVLESAAVGVPDERSGEAVKLFVVRSDPALGTAAVVEHCRRNLTGYKNPKHVVFVDALPKSTVGKVLRRELRDAA